MLREKDLCFGQKRLWIIETKMNVLLIKDVLCKTVILDFQKRNGTSVVCSPVEVPVTFSVKFIYAPNTFAMVHRQDPEALRLSQLYVTYC